MILRFVRMIGMFRPRASETLCFAVVTFLFFILQMQIWQQRQSFQSTTIITYPTNKPLTAGDNSLASRRNLAFHKVIIYNRIPKTAGTTIVSFFYQLAMANQFNAVLVNFSRIHNVLALHDEANFVYNVSDWISVQPILFHGHFPYIEFAKFGSNTRPLWINVIRDPLERQVSYYYFIRYGDNLRPHVTRSRQGDSTTFDECVAKELSRDCSNETLWMQIPYFCGNAQHCTIPGSLWAFEEAKRNVIEKYLLVGTVDDLQDFANVLEHLVPYYFTGLSKLYQKGDNHIRQTRFKQALKEETISKIKQTDTYRLELLFYRFVKANFEQVKARVLFQHKRSQYEYPFIYQKARGPTLRFDT